MKKTVVFLIGIIYIISIAVVTFLGSTIGVDQFTVYMTEIEIVNYDKMDADGTKRITINFNENEGYASVFVDYKVGPDNATHPDKVAFSITENTYTNKEGNTKIYATISNNGEVIFYYNLDVTVKVTVYTVDGLDKSDSVYIRCKKSVQ